ncbi:alpha/beta fold hydrolase [Paenibacillaceae bacterium WGS1546]|uniref:alpha/beta fold hydrolase n=1 Tax=Cohnella sp. WGS1546 TaxID=3366810 RepID=UPI00372D144E
MPYFRHEGIDFHYKDEGEGMPFLFQHGLGGSIEQPSGLYEPVRDVRFVSCDFRGHGETRRFGSPDKFGFAAFTHDLLALLDHLGIARAVVGGISMGAGAALHFALHYPERVSGLVLSRVAWQDEPQPESSRSVYELVARLIRECGAEEGRRRFLETDVYARMAEAYPDAAASLARQFEYPYAEETWPKLEAIPADAPNFDRREWATIQVPTLVLANRLDPLHPFAYGELLASRIPHASFKELVSKSVDPSKHVEQCRAYVSEFLQTLVERGG